MLDRQDCKRRNDNAEEWWILAVGYLRMIQDHLEVDIL